MTVVYSSGSAVFTGTPFEELENTTHQSVNVDSGKVHIDADDPDHVIRIKHTRNNNVDILAAIDTVTNTTTAKIASDGVIYTPNVVYGPLDTSLNTFTSDAVATMTENEALLAAARQPTTG